MPLPHFDPRVCQVGEDVAEDLAAGGDDAVGCLRRRLPPRRALEVEPDGRDADQELCRAHQLRGDDRSERRGLGRRGLLSRRLVAPVAFVHLGAEAERRLHGSLQGLDLLTAEEAV